MAVTNATTVSHEDRVQSVYERVVMLKKKLGIPYNKMGAEAGLTRGQMEKLTQKSRRMTEENLDKLVTYLDSMGF
jgi:hypothetical protein